MYKNKRILALIPARGGSKGVLRKNIRLVAGKPLIAWTIEEAKKSKFIDRTILSSDDEEIIAIARQWNCDVPFTRPAELARDDVTAIDPVLHALEAIEEKYDYLVLLQTTSPLRIVEDIDACIAKCIDECAPACVTVTTATKSPYWMYSLNDRGVLDPIMKSEIPVLLRQQIKGIYVLNGAVYVAKIDWFIKNRKFISNETTAYPMPQARSIDIDTQWDLKICDIFCQDREGLKAA